MSLCGQCFNCTLHFNYHRLEYLITGTSVFLEGYTENRCNIIRLCRRNLYGQSLNALCERNIAVAQEFHLVHLTAIGRFYDGECLEGEAACCRPAHDGCIYLFILLHIAHVLIRVVVALVETLFADWVNSLCQRTFTEALPHTGAIYTFAVDIHPCLDTVEHITLLVVDGSVTANGNGEKQVTVLGNDIHKHGNHLLGTLVVGIVDIIVPRTDTGTGLPVLGLWTVGNTALYVPKESLLLRVIENLTHRYNLLLTFVLFCAGIVEMLKDIQTDGLVAAIERQYGIVKIQHIWIIVVDTLQHTVLELHLICLGRQAGTIAPSPLTVDSTAILPT